jgi:hypothetical protein
MKQPSETTTKPQEDHPRTFEDYERKSTAVSCQERQSQKEAMFRNYGNSPEIQYENPPVEEHDVQDRVIHQLKGNEQRQAIPQDRSLLDELFEKHNKEMEELGPEYSSY